MLKEVWTMRRVVQLAVAMALLLAFMAFAGVALADVLADVITCPTSAPLLCEGTPRDDVMTGTDGPDTILGRAGNDTISGLAHTDTLYGNLGNDTLNGGAGQDTLRGNSGDDDLTGGPDETKGPRLTDEYFCGAGVDTVHLEKSESAVHNIAPSCEIIVRN